MPFKNWTDAKRRLDQMIAAVSPEMPGGTVSSFERNYGGTLFVITVADGLDEPLLMYGMREYDKWQAINLIKTWDSPERDVSPIKRDWEFA